MNKRIIARSFHLALSLLTVFAMVIPAQGSALAPAVPAAEVSTEGAVSPAPLPETASPASESSSVPYWVPALHPDGVPGDAVSQIPEYRLAENSPTLASPPDDCDSQGVRVLNPYNASETLEAKFCAGDTAGRGELWLRSNATVAHVVKIQPDPGVENLNPMEGITWRGSR